MSEKKRKMRSLENKIGHWTERIDKIRSHARAVHASKVAAATTDAQRDHWNAYLEGELKRADRLYAEQVEPINTQLRDLMFSDDEPNDGLDA